MLDRGDPPGLTTIEMRRRDSFFRLAREGETGKNELAGFLQTMAMLRELGDSHPYLVRPPIPMQKVAASLLGPVARLLGRPALP